MSQCQLNHFSARYATNKLLCSSQMMIIETRALSIAIHQPFTHLSMIVMYVLYMQKL